MLSETPTQPQSVADVQDATICLRSIKASGLLTIFATLLLWGANQNAWAWGFLIGALLSLLSFISITVLVPFLFRPDMPRHAAALIVVTLFMKLPLFMVGLYLATNVRGVSPAACVFGIALGPAVITLKTLGDVLTRSLPAKQPKAQAAPSIEAAPDCAPVRPPRAVAKELAPDLMI